MKLKLSGYSNWLLTRATRLLTSAWVSTIAFTLTCVCVLPYTIFFFAGVCFTEGTGVFQNVDEAARLYKHAADQGISAAQFNLGEFQKMLTHFITASQTNLQCCNNLFRKKYNMRATILFGQVFSTKTAQESQRISRRPRSILHLQLVRVMQKQQRNQPGSRFQVLVQGVLWCVAVTFVPSHRAIYILINNYQARLYAKVDHKINNIVCSCCQNLLVSE